MAVNLLSWRSMTALVNKQVSPDPFILNRYFTKNTVSHLAKRVDIDIVASGVRNIAHLRNSNQESYTVGKRDRSRLTITLPEAAEKKHLAEDELGSQVGSGMNPYASGNADLQAARNELIANETQDLRDRQIRLWELMATQALQGSIAISQPEVGVDVSLDFGFQAGVHTKAYSGASKWDQSGVDILEQLFTERKGVMGRGGSNVNDCILGSTAASLFRSNAAVRAELHNFNLRAGTMDLTQQNGIGATYLGSIIGINFFEYSQDYVNAAGSVVPMIGADKAILVANTRNQRYHKGPVFRNGGIQSYAQFFARQWQEEDPDGTNIEVASCGIPAVHNPDEILVLTVV